MKIRRFAVTLRDERNRVLDRRVGTPAEIMLTFKRHFEARSEAGMAGIFTFEPLVSVRVNNMEVRPNDKGWEVSACESGKLLQVFEGDDARTKAFLWAEQTFDFVKPETAKQRKA